MVLEVFATMSLIVLGAISIATFCNALSDDEGLVVTVGIIMLAMIIGVAIWS